MTTTRIDATLTGVANLQQWMVRWQDQANKATLAAVLEAGREIKQASLQQFGTSSGPVNRTGRLAKSIIVTKPNRFGQFGWSAQVGPTAPYARRVELGSRRPAHKPHPYFTPGYLEASKRFEEIFRKSWEQARRG